MHAGRLRPMAESESIVLEGNMSFWRGRLAGEFLREGFVCFEGYNIVMIGCMDVGLEPQLRLADTRVTAARRRSSSEDSDT